MSKVLVFNLSGHGHVNPTLAVVQELTARGEEVIYYLTDEFKHKIQSTGATFRRYEPMAKEQRQSLPSDTFPCLFEIFSRMLREGLQFIIPQLLDEVRAERPDYIIYDSLCLWGKLLTKILQIPAIAFHCTYASNEHFNLFDLSAAHNSQASPPTTNPMTALRSDVEQLCTTYGIQPFEPSDLLLDDELFHIVCMPRAFQPAGDTFDERFVFVGPTISPGAETNDFPLDRLGEQPVLYISLGTAYNNWLDFFQMCLTAFGGQPWQVVMSIGTKIDRSALGSIPDNFIVDSYVPQLAVLKHTDVFLTHGGMNSVMEALYYGVPLVAIPQMLEQAITAERVAQLGLGVAIEKTAVTQSILLSAVATVANDPQFRETAQQMQEVVRSTGGYRQAAEAILQFKESARKLKG
jgi:MGT family glycosyltransferase